MSARPASPSNRSDEICAFNIGWLRHRHRASRMNNEWQEFAVYSSAASAEAMAGRLRSEAVPVRVTVIEPVPGLTYEVRVLVPSHLLHRARWVVAQAQFSDDELASCALRPIDPGAEDPSQP